MLPLRRPAVAIALLVGAVGHADPAADAPSLIARYHAEGSFIDNPFALSADGRRIAWLTTDGATHTEVHLATIGDKGEAPAFPFDGITPERVEFLDGERVLVVDRSADSGFARA